MKNRSILPLLSINLALLALMALFWFAGSSQTAIARDIPEPSLSLRRVPNLEGLTITAVDPNTAPNDVSAEIIIQGTGFTTTISGTAVITAPVVYLGNQELADVLFGDTTILSATLPWGLEPGVYPLTVINPNGISVTLQNAFTVSNGIGVWTSNGPYGGKISQIVVHPRQPDTVIALGNDVGVFASADAAKHWDMVFRKPAWHDEYAFDAIDDNVIYVGDEHALYRTTDGAQTWEKISIHSEWDEYEHTPTAHPTISGTVYAAVGSYQNPSQVGGVFRSDDYGTSWITLTEGLTDTHFTSLAIHPIYTQTLAAGTVNGNVFYSLDGGQTWNWSTHLTDTVAILYFNPYEPLQVWATLGVTTGQDKPGEVQNLFKSEDWINWEKINTGADLYSDGRWGWDLDFTPGEIWATTAGTFLSTDGGITWTPQPDGPCGEARWLAINPVNSLIRYVGGDRGACKSVDGGLTWEKSVDGLAAIIPAETAVDPHDPETVYVRAASLDLAKSENGGQAWRVLDFPTPFWHRVGLAVDPVIANRLYANDLLSIDGGQTFTPMTFTLPITWVGWGLDGVNYYAPHPTQPGRILAGVGVSQVHTHNGLIYASDDYGDHWNYLGPTEPISWVVTIAYDAVTPDVVYAATRQTGLWKSSDGGENWEKLALFEDFDEAWEVFTHPEQGDTVYTFARRSTDSANKLLISEDAGENWIALPDGYSTPFYFAPTQPPSLYAACYYDNLALCRSWDGGYNWETVSTTRQEIVTLSGGTDGERVIIYVGTKGGEVSAESNMQALNIIPFSSIPGRGSVTGSGVYRLTTLIRPPWVYLPLILH